MHRAVEILILSFFWFWMASGVTAIHAAAKALEPEKKGLSKKMPQLMVLLWLMIPHVVIAQNFLNCAIAFALGVFVAVYGTKRACDKAAIERSTRNALISFVGYMAYRFIRF